MVKGKTRSEVGGESSYTSLPSACLSWAGVHAACGTHVWPSGAVFHPERLLCCKDISVVVATGQHRLLSSPQAPPHLPVHPTNHTYGSPPHPSARPHCCLCHRGRHSNLPYTDLEGGAGTVNVSLVTALPPRTRHCHTYTYCVRSSFQLGGISRHSTLGRSIHSGSHLSAPGHPTDKGRSGATSTAPDAQAAFLPAANQASSCSVIQ